jgi:uncharacterized membrane protein YidH (DUF202 family)
MSSLTSAPPAPPPLPEWASASELQVSKQTQLPREQVINNYRYLMIFGLLLGFLVLMSNTDVPLSDDLGAYHYPFRVIYSESLKQGKTWEWNRAVFCGYDVHGEGQLGGDHPWHRLIYQFLPVNAAFKLEWFVPYPLFGFGMFWWLRRWRLGREAAVMSALTLTLSGYMVQRNVHMNATQVIAHLPWLLGLQWLVLRRIRQQQPWSKLTWPLVGIALLTGSQLLLGYPQYVLYSVLIEGVHALALCSLLGPRSTTQTSVNPFAEETPESNSDSFGKDEPTPTAISTPQKWPRFLGALTIAKVVAIFLGASQLLASWDYLRLSERANWSGEEALYGSWHPLNLLQLVAPYALPNQVYGGDNNHELSVYVGTLALVMMLYGLFSKPKKPTMRVLRGLGICLCLLGFSLAIGEFGPFKHLLPIMPVFNRFRLPCRATLIMLVGIVLLAAVGWQRLRVVSRTLMHETFDYQKLTTLLKPLSHLLIAIALTLIVVLATVYYYVDRNMAFNLLIFQVVAFPLIHLLMLNKVFLPKLVGCFVIALLIETGMYNNHFFDFTSSAFDDSNKLDFNKYNNRSCDAELLQSGNQFALNHAHVNGYAGVKPKRISHYEIIPEQNCESVGIQDLQLLKTANETNNSDSNNNFFGYPILPPLIEYPLEKPFLVAEFLPSKDWFPAITQVSLQQTAITEHSVELPGLKKVQTKDNVNSEPVTSLSVQPTLTDPGDMHYAIQTDRAALLVTTESYHHGWQATVDGQPVTPVRVNGDFLGVPVPANAQSVECRFVSKIHQIGRWTSCFALVLCGACVLWSQRQRAVHSIT